MDKFNVKKAIQEIVSGQTIKMESCDFKTHLFYKSTSGYGKPVIHEVRKMAGAPITLHLTYDELKEKFGDQKFYIYE